MFGLFLTCWLSVVSRFELRKRVGIGVGPFMNASIRRYPLWPITYSKLPNVVAWRGMRYVRCILKSEIAYHSKF